MNEPHALRDALPFLGRFLLFSTLFSLVWTAISPLYTASLLQAINALLEAGERAIRLEQQGNLLLLVHRSAEGGVRRLHFSGQEMLYLHAVSALALFAATPAMRRADRLRWAAIALAAFWLAHVLSLCAGSLLALADYWEGLTAAHRLELLESGWQEPARHGETLLRRLSALWNTWGWLSLTLGLWIAGARTYLLERVQPEGARS